MVLHSITQKISLPSLIISFCHLALHYVYGLGKNHISVQIAFWYCMHCVSITNITFHKDKSPKVPFHRITLSYSYFEFLRQFSLMCKKGKTLLGFVNKLFIYFQLIFFFDHVLLLAELAQKFKLLQNSCMAKWWNGTSGDLPLQVLCLYLKSK